MNDQEFMQLSVELAQRAEEAGNLPVGSLITLDGKVVAKGPSRVYQPHHDLTRHAEMEALRALPPELWKNKESLVLYTTLAPCPMCLGAILLYGIPRVVYGAEGEFDGGKALADHLPPFFKERFQNIEWVGPTMPAVCDPLHQRLLEIEKEKSD
ncbi:MAG: nucleoside deaminase [Bacteroidetes bacterium]|nr:MAG: nucleoside deaminase [Bacteroidota bacterium]